MILLDSHDYGDPCWTQDPGETVISAIAADSTMPGPPERTWAINFRVDDLDAIVARLRAAGVEVEPHPEPYPNGRFAELADPEGNRIQLWEPEPAAPSR